MELGCDAVLCASAISRAEDPVAMARAMRARRRRPGASRTAPAGSRAASTPRRPRPRTGVPEFVSSELAHVDDLIDRWQRAWSGRDPGAFAALCAADVRYEDPLTPEPLEGAAALGRHARRLWHGAPRRAPRAHGRAPVRRRVRRRTRARCSAPTGARLGPLRRHGRFLVVHGVFYGELDRRPDEARAGFFDLYAAAVQLGAAAQLGAARRARAAGPAGLRPQGY